MERSEFQVIKNDVNLDENVAKIMDVVKQENFEFHGQNEENDNILMFMNMKEKIILEVGMLSFNFKLVYANQMMSGFLDTGWHENILKPGFLKQVLIEFVEPVSILRNYYEKQ